MTSDVTGVGDIGWRASSLCASGECVQVARSRDTIVVRSSADPDRQLRFTLSEWDDFLGGVRAGDFDDVAESSAG
ncbi:MAG: DUF397 domain-containing protein [Streptosporangiaceae bacterium]